MNVKEWVWGLKQGYYIYQSDRYAPLQGELQQSGYVALRSFFAKEDMQVTERLVSSLDTLEKENREALVHRISNPIEICPFLYGVLEDARVQEMVYSYLGSDACFDFCNCWRTTSMPGGEYGSGRWHHDSVGHRLKIFLLLNDTVEGFAPSTLFCLKSHLLRHRSFTYEDTRFSDSYIRENFALENLCGEVGDLLVFDTNALHKGSYEGNGTHRDIVQFEFSSRRKSSKITGDIGPRKTVFPISLMDKLQSNNLIDQRYLTSDSIRCYYGKPPLT